MGSAVKRILAVADTISPYIYRETFPKGFEGLDLVLCAGDLPGYYIEFLATKVTCPVVWVQGNHGEEKVKDYLGNLTPPGGAIPAHGRIVEVAGLRIVGWGGAPRYNESTEGQYTGFEAQVALGQLEPTLWWRKWRTGRDIDIFLTHAPPPGPHAGTDFAHRPCKQIGKFMDRHVPPLFVHGHVHNYEGRRVEYTTAGGTRVVNAYGYVLLELPMGARQAARVT